MPVKLILRESVVHTPFNAFHALTIVSIQACLLLALRIRFYPGTGNKTPDSSATSLFRNKHIVEAKPPNTSCKSNMAM
jgi:hypothetical protein